LTSNSQKEREKDFLLQFKSLYQDFPDGEIIPGEDPPDFVVVNKYQRIGFEITEIYPQSNSEENSFDERLELERSILAIACTLFKKSNNSSLNVIAQFKPAIKISKPQKKILAKEISDTILNALIQNQSDIKYLHLRDSRILPNEIEEIRIIIQSNNSTPIWQSGHGSLIRELSVSELAARIEAKESSFIIGNEYKEQWLLIVEPDDKLTFSYIPDFIEQQMDSNFHKIFILRSLFNTTRRVKI